jgi:hypothetical protein
VGITEEKKMWIDIGTDIIIYKITNAIMQYFNDYIVAHWRKAETCVEGGRCLISA